MKKIYLALVAALMAAVIPMQVIADTPQLTAKNDEEEVAVSITNSLTTQLADELLPDFKKSTTPVTKELTLKAEAGVIASLRIQISETPTEGKETPLNNFNVIVVDAEENVVYNSATGMMAKRNDSYKEITLGELQANEEKTYKITYALVDESVDVSKISVTLAAKSNIKVTPGASGVKETPAPKFDFDSLEKQDEFIFDFADEFKESTTGTSNKSNEITKVCGKDIPAGRFSITGNGKLKISSATGSVKSESVVSETPVAGKSVKTAVVLLESGDVLSITPLDGEEKARLKFNKVTTATTTATATPIKSTASPKTNPKTGDGSVGIVIGVALLAVLAVGALEYMKRKSRSN
ncbi:MAG: hypothetical protein IJC09_06580 [Clostridia bacterium]|nr:hypothetical protein [Clostridia bacterium]